MYRSTTTTSAIQVPSASPLANRGTSLSTTNSLQPHGQSIISGPAMRTVAFATSVGILGASTWAVIDAGQLTGSSAGLAVALAAGVAVGASIIPRMRSRGLAVGLVLALAASECSNLIAVAERVVVARDAAASKLASDNGLSAAAVVRIAKAERALAEYRAAAVAAIATPGCARECRGLLEGQGAALVSELATARTAALAVPVMRSATPLADRLGVAAWVLDLLAAGLLSVGANGLAAMLIAWASQTAGRRDPASIQNDPIMTRITASAIRTNPAQTPVESSDARDRIKHGSSLPEQPKRDGGVATSMPSATHDPVSARTRWVLKLIQQCGGTLTGSQRVLAGQLGLSQPGLSRALGEAKAAGLVAVSCDRVAGTRIALVVA
jgi:hypothetical protein